MDPVAAPVQPTLDDSPSLLDGPTGDSTALGCVKVFVRDLSDGARVESPFVVRDVTRRQKKNGDSFLKLQLGDATGAVAHAADCIDRAGIVGAIGRGLHHDGAAQA